MKKMLSLIVALVLMLTCGQAFAAGTELIVATEAGVEDKEWFQNALAEFQAMHPDVDVVIEPHEGISARSKFVSAVYAGNAPDILMANLYWVKDFALNGWLIPLSDYVDEGYFEDFFPDFVDYCTVDGKIYGIHNSTDIATIIYRKSMLEAAGIEPPALDEAWTWEELAENAQKLNQDTDGDGNTDVWGCGVIGYVGGATTYTNFPLFFMLGGELIDENGMPAFNTEAAYGACDYYHDLIYKYEVAPKESYAYSNTELLSAFNAGQYAMIFGASYMVSDLAAQFPGDIGVMLYPVPDENTVSEGLSGGWPWVIMTQQGDEVAAISADFIKCMLSEEAYLGRYEDNGALPIRTSVFDSIIANAEGDEADWMTVYSAQMQHTNLKPGDAIYDYIQEEYTIALQKVMMDEATSQEAMQEAYDNTIQRATDAGIIG